MAKTKRAEKTTMIQPLSHRRASVAANLANKTLVEFLSEAADRAAEPILRKHGIDPAKIQVAA